MKNKSTRHKESNTFTFQSFSQRIENINIDVFHRIGHANENDTEDDGTYLLQGLQKWNVLNLSVNYDAFRKELPAVGTLPQILNKKDEIVQVFLKHLKQKNILALQSILELVVALAKDLQQDFYPFYPDFLLELINLINKKEPDLLEWVFTCLAYIFKSLWRCMVKDLKTVFDSLLPLLDSSKPPYVNNFAAESFAYVARKARDKKKFLFLVLTSLKSNPDGVAGCGRLLFETVRGVSGQFHSCAEVVLPLLFASLDDRNLPRKLLHQVLSHAVEAMLQNIALQKNDIFWKSAVDAVEQFTVVLESSEGDMRPLCRMLNLVLQAALYKDCVFLRQPVPLMQVLLKLLGVANVPHAVLGVVLKIAAALLQSQHVPLPQEHASHFMIKVKGIAHQDLILSFTEQVFGYPGFEGYLLPYLLHQVTQQDERIEIIRLLTRRILYKAPLCRTGAELATWQPYPLDFSSAIMSGDKQSFPDKLLLMVRAASLEDMLKDPSLILCALLCLPHVRPLDKTATLVALNLVITTLCIALLKERIPSGEQTNVKQNIQDSRDNEIPQDSSEVEQGQNEPMDVTQDIKGPPEEGIYSRVSDDSMNKLLFLLSVTMESVIHIANGKELGEVLNMEVMLSVLLPHASNPQHVTALRTLDVFLTAFARMHPEEGVSTALLDRLYQALAVNLSSPFKQIRTLTAHMFSTLEPANGVFSLCLATEEVPHTVLDTRRKLQCMQRLEFAPDCSWNPKFAEAPLHYLLGMLYINFQPLWEPASQLIGSFAHGLPTAQFWEIFGSRLHLAVEQSRSSLAPHLDLKCEFLTDLYDSMVRMEDSPDYPHHRILLWQAMEKFPEVAESRNRDIAMLLLTFVQEEYSKSAPQLVNLTNMDHQELMEVDDPVMKDNLSKIRGKETVKTLLAHLSFFSKMRSPRTMFREPELNKLYLRLLEHRNKDIQEKALDCIFTYKHKFLQPYKDHLYSLLNDKTFKAELTSFRIDPDDDFIQAEHRDDLMPLVLRILYGKMLGSGGRTGGKGQHRRSLVLRFLTGCTTQEVLIFLRMSFRIYADYLQEDPLLMVRTISDTLDLQQTLHPKRMQSSVNLAGVFLEQFGSLSSPEPPAFLLRVLLCAGAIIGGISARRNLARPGMVNTMRNARTSCIEAVAKFFERYEKFPWSEQELDAVFEVCVWPQLDKLPSESIHSPTALLKLFLTWSHHPRYFALLVKHYPDQPDLAPLPYIMKLLLVDKAHKSVGVAIMNLVEKLLTLQDLSANSQETGVPPIQVTPILPVDWDSVRKLHLPERLNYGSCLLLPHVLTLLDKLHRRLRRSKGRSLGSRDLAVLSRVSELVREGPPCDALLQLLVPTLATRGGAGEEVVSSLLATVDHLVRNSATPAEYLRPLSPLFQDVVPPGPRKLLCRLLETMAGPKEAELVGELNAWDARWVERPDFGRRLDAFKRVREMLEAREMTVELGVVVLYHCFHVLKTETDLSMKDSAGYCLRQLAPGLCMQFKDSTSDREYLINDTILRLVGEGIKDKTEAVKDESIALLGEMARECGDLHPVLNDLSRFTSKVDPEVDLFNNLRHLQMHRKVRALLKFCQVAKQMEKPPNSRTLTQFIMPLASPFLVSESFSGKNTIVDAAIETVGTVCRLLPWHQYEAILSHYLSKLRTHVEFQKQLVRIVTAILDSFHFDISQAVLHKGVAMETCTSTETKEVDEEELDQEEGAVTHVKLLVPAYNRVTVLSGPKASRVVQDISTGLLARLGKVLAERTQGDVTHKLNRKSARTNQDEEQVLRVPLALAATKLLQKLSPQFLQQYLPGILSKLCTFLKSRLESVRRAARHTLQQIALALGPTHLHAIVSEMCTLLTRGFQVHVLAFTLHAVLSCLAEQYQPGHMDSCLQLVLKVCQTDLFGSVAEEKEVSGITGKHLEARSNKSFHVFQLLAQFVTEKCLTDLLLPLKQVLGSTHSHKVVTRVADCLRYIVLGLGENSFVSVESQLLFSYGTASESIPELSISDKPETKPALEQGRQRPDTFLIPRPPKNRSGGITAARTSNKTNVHLLIEFGLRLFYNLLKKDKLRTGDFRSYVDPMVPILAHSTSSQHIRVSTLGLQCLCWVLKMDLPAMKDNVDCVAKDLFAILHKYATSGLVQGDNFTLVMAAFKTMTVLVRDVKYYTLNEDQLKVLLLYAEQDMNDSGRQVTAFHLLRAVLRRKLVAPELYNVMDKVAETSIVANLDHVRLQARQVFLQYLMDYPVGKRFDRHLAFYLSQLEYELQPGRESALEMIHSIANALPLPVLVTKVDLLFVTLGARLVNDDVPQCRKMVAQCIKVLLARMENNKLNQLFMILVTWFNSTTVAFRAIAAQMCGLFVSLEKEKFESRLEQVLPLIVTQFDQDSASSNMPGRFVRAPTNPNSLEYTSIDEHQEHLLDHHLFQVLTLLLKIFQHCPNALKDPNRMVDVVTIGENCQALLVHPHEWVRLGASQLLGCMFASLDPHQLATAALSGKDNPGFLMSNTRQALKSLTLDLCAQLHPGELVPEFVQQVTKDLVFLARVLKDIPDEGKVRLSLPWLVSRMRRAVNTEVIHAPLSITVRTAVFKWMGAVAVDLGKERLPAMLPQLLAPLVRELGSVEETGAPLKKLAREVTKVMKKAVGVEEFNKHCSLLQTGLDARRAERKKIRTQQAITEPEVAAKRKIRKQLKKKDIKKRKLDVIKGRKIGKIRRRQRNVDLEGD